MSADELRRERDQQNMARRIRRGWEAALAGRSALVAPIGNRQAGGVPQSFLGAEGTEAGGSGLSLVLGAAAAQAIASGGAELAYTDVVVGPVRAGIEAPTLPTTVVAMPYQAVASVLVRFRWDDWRAGGVVQLLRDGTVVDESPYGWGPRFEGVLHAGAVDVGEELSVLVDHGDGSSHDLIDCIAAFRVEGPARALVGDGEVLESTWLDSRVGSVTTSTVLTLGEEYRVLVTGNIRHNPSAGITYGSPDTILFPSPTFGADNAMRDAETFYADVIPGSYPYHAGTGHTSPFEFNTGSGWAHPEPIGGPYSTPQAGHAYVYAVTGEGSALQARVPDSILTDNNGMLKIELMTGGTP